MNQKSPKTKQQTPPKKQTSQQSSTNENQLLDSLLKALAPVVEFHKSVEGAKDTDLRLFWDVRVIKGADTPMYEFNGSSSLTGALSPRQLPLLTDAVQREVSDKIATPLVSRMQQLIDELNSEFLRINANKLTERVTQKQSAEEMLPKSLEDRRVQEAELVIAGEVVSTADEALERATEG